ncbi:hypothetical protein EMCG_00302 [[Emmonsia] crescens]|uniref:Uncharacterized protein n=1 Tax=[Emmonsia] crescens TaxID=73230 RepID=A0A0G2HXR9_9EURO|nr:hypothetical protein EMCG_00302 [Emmonsia crescens UAMH 3008]
MEPDQRKSLVRIVREFIYIMPKLRMGQEIREEHLLALLHHCLRPWLADGIVHFKGNLEVLGLLDKTEKSGQNQCILQPQTRAGCLAWTGGVRGIPKEAHMAVVVG